jgi:hypothetical protein
MSNSALEALHAANASYCKELEQIDAQASVFSIQSLGT